MRVTLAENSVDVFVEQFAALLPFVGNLFRGRLERLCGHSLTIYNHQSDGDEDPTENTRSGNHTSCPYGHRTLIPALTLADSRRVSSREVVVSEDTTTSFVEKGGIQVTLSLTSATMDTKEDIPGVELSVTTGSLVLPGGDIARLVDGPPAGIDTDVRKLPVVRLGPGMTQRYRALFGSKCGVVSTDSKRIKLWLETNQRRYIPAMEGMIIGIVQENISEEYRLDINGTDTTILLSLAFEGATKKYSPALGIGSLVYSRVIRASKNMEVEVSCV